MPPSSDLALPIGEADMAPSATPVYVLPMKPLPVQPTMYLTICNINPSSANMLPADDGLGLIGSEDGDKDDDEDGDASGLDIAELLRRAGVETRGKIVRTTSVPTKPQAGGQSSKAKSPKSKGNAVENVETDRSLAQTRGGQTGK
ncbi:hypothetical protein PsYK624_044470 [Phanerochaete sordida]|uniref:Uncharacterized protein n=1 Tax=Phanerochaete sordida TaxID=48140 RepID=A0A9P3G5R0_9APHY|nr:hypothetical protein PsYK624_044470 [Phanerochaete sordida]